MTSLRALTLMRQHRKAAQKEAPSLRALTLMRQYRKAAQEIAPSLRAQRSNLEVFAVIISLGLFFAPVSCSAYADPAAKNLAVFVFGSSGDSEFREYFEGARAELGGILAANGFGLPQQKTFSESGGAGERSERGILDARFLELAQAGPYDDVFLFVAGHASGRDEAALFHLPGRDMALGELLDLAAKIKAHRRVLVIAAPQSHIWIRRFNGPETIVIAGNQKREFDFIPVQFLKNFPRMFEKAARCEDGNVKFPRAYRTHGGPVPTGQNRSISLAEVFLRTKLRVERWYDENNLLATEFPVLAAGKDAGLPALAAADQVHLKIQG